MLLILVLKLQVLFPVLCELLSATVAVRNSQKVSIDCLCAGGTSKPGRKGLNLANSLVIVDKLLSNFVIHD